MMLAFERKENVTAMSLTFTVQFEPASNSSVFMLFYNSF